MVRPVRAFLRGLIDLTIGIKAAHHRIRHNKTVKDDLRVWLSFLTKHNCKSFLLPDIWSNSNKLNLYTDAEGSLGFGAIFGNSWCYGKRPESWLHLNIAILEFYPIVLSLYLWGERLSNQCVLFFY